MSITIKAGVYVDPASIIIGDVTIEEGASIWPCAVLRGDLNRIEIGEGSNVQEHVAIHGNADFPNIIGKNVSIGHGAVIHGATIGDHCIIGMHSTILNGAVIGEDCIIAAGALITSGTNIPPRSLVLGVPGKVVKENDPTIRARAAKNAEDYHKLRDEFLIGKHPRHRVQ